MNLFVSADFWRSVITTASIWGSNAFPRLKNTSDQAYIIFLNLLDLLSILEINTLNKLPKLQIDKLDFEGFLALGVINELPLLYHSSKSESIDCD